MKKRLLSFFIILGLCTSFFMPVYAEPIQGHVEETDIKPQGEDDIFTDEVKHIEQNQIIHLTVSQVLNGTTSIEGDEFFATVSTDVLADSGILLPVGTIAHGTIKNIVDPKRFNRDGYIELSFDYLITPDGREIPIEGNMTSKLTPAKGIAQKTGESVAYTAAGGIYGAVAAMEIAGIPGAVASSGYTVLGGAAIGGVIALGLTLFKKGKDVLIAPGDEIKIKIKSSEAIPVMKEEALRQEEKHYDGLDVKISNIYLEQDPFDNWNTISLDLIIKNYSEQDFSTFDIELVSDLRTPYRPSIFTDYKNSLAMKTVKRGDSISGILSFSVDDPKRQHWLVFYDKRNHKPLAKISIDNAKKDLNITDITKTKKKRKRL